MARGRRRMLAGLAAIAAGALLLWRPPKPSGRARSPRRPASGGGSASPDEIDAAPARTPPPAPDALDPNRATLEALQTLPGIGPVLAERIVAAREDAPFADTDDLLRVPGIGEATLAALRPRLRSRAPAGPPHGPG